jgi:hypothetical protein
MLLTAFDTGQHDLFMSFGTCYLSLIEDWLLVQFQIFALHSMRTFISYTESFQLTKYLLPVPPQRVMKKILLDKQTAERLKSCL